MLLLLLLKIATSTVTIYADTFLLLWCFFVKLKLLIEGLLFLVLFFVNDALAVHFGAFFSNHFAAFQCFVATSAVVFVDAAASFFSELFFLWLVVKY